MSRLFLSLLFFVFLASFFGQDSISNSLAADKIKTLYNEKKYADIYTLLGSEQKKTISEKDFVEFMHTNIFYKQGTCEKLVHLKEEAGHSEFIGYFTQGHLLLKLNTNKARIELLQFLPYPGTFHTKITSYGSDNPRQNALDSLVDKKVADFMASPQNCGLSIAIFTNTKQQLYNYGETKRDSKNIPSVQTIYEIGSVSAVFCGALLAQAILENKVKATDDIRLYLPKGKFKNLVMNNEPVRLIHLANHTSGLPRIPNNLQTAAEFDPFDPYSHYTKETLFKYLETAVLETPPGTTCNYSNIGLGLLGIILETVYNKSFEELMKEKICEPNGMKNTTIGLTVEQEKQFATGYNSEGNETPHWYLPAIPAAGAIRSTPGDMLTFAKKNLEETDAAFKLSHQETFNDGIQKIGMAWQIQKTRQGNTLIWHNGATYGSSNFCGFVKEKNCAVVVMSNSATSVDMIALAILKFLQEQN